MSHAHMRSPRLLPVAALLLSTSALAACGGSDSGSASASGAVKVFSCKPQNPLIPTNTNEVCGGDILDNVFTGLVNYDPDTAVPFHRSIKRSRSSPSSTST